MGTRVVSVALNQAENVVVGVTDTLQIVAFTFKGLFYVFKSLILGSIVRTIIGRSFSLEGATVRPTIVLSIAQRLHDKPK